MAVPQLQLRPLSPRPEVVVDDFTSRRIIDNTVPSGIAGTVGQSGPLSPGRLVAALPTDNNGPQQVAAAQVIQGIDMFYLADPAGNMIGDQQAVWVHRMLICKRVSNTRRIF